jgi:hypothetical protein
VPRGHQSGTAVPLWRAPVRPGPGWHGDAEAVDVKAIEAPPVPAIGLHDFN